MSEVRGQMLKRLNVCSAANLIGDPIPALRRNLSQRHRVNFFIQFFSVSLCLCTHCERLRFFNGLKGGYNMKLNAIYENGRIYFDRPVRLKKKKIPVLVVVDNEAVLSMEAKDESTRPVEGESSSLLQRIHDILGPDYKYVPTDKSDKELLMEALEEKYCR
jgi:hypothetical protein